MNVIKDLTGWAGHWAQMLVSALQIFYYIHNYKLLELYKCRFFYSVGFRFYMEQTQEVICSTELLIHSFMHAENLSSTFYQDIKSPTLRCPQPIHSDLR